MIGRSWFLSRLAVLFVGALVIGLTPARPLAASSSLLAEVRRYRVEGVVTREQRSAISATGVDIEGTRPGPVEIVATADQVQQIRALGFAVQPSAQPPDIPLDVTDYHNYNDLTAEVLAVAARYPQITQLFSIGLSFEGRDLWAMKISDNAQTDEDEPEVLLVGHYSKPSRSVKWDEVFLEGCALKLPLFVYESCRIAISRARASYRRDDALPLAYTDR